MGIRIRKVMGYGLADLHLNDEGDIEDRRVAPDLYDLHDRSFHMQMSEYAAWLDKRYEGETSRPAFSDQGVYKHLVKTDERYGDESAWDYLTVLDGNLLEGDDDLHEGVLLLRPWSLSDWYRFDNPIDFAEHEARLEAEDDWMKTQVQLLDSNPWPFVGMWADKRSGRRIEQDYWQLLQVYGPKGRQPEPETAQKLVKLMGFKSVEQANEHFGPAVPAPIQELSEWLGIFPDAATVHTLRPMIVTYWS